MILRLVLPILALAPSCESVNKSAEVTDSPMVVTTFYPLEEAARRVGGDATKVENLTPPGVEPHDLELTSDDLMALTEADVVVYMDSGFQPAVEAAIPDVRGSLVDGLAGQDLLPPPGGEGELAVDPHIWLDPMRFAAVVRTVAEALSEQDPEQAGTYRSNARRFVDELESLDREFAKGLEDCRTRVIVTNHAAFGYLAHAYGLRQESISGLTPESEPVAERLAELVRMVEENGVTTIFTEELLPPDIAETLASEAGVSVHVLFTIEGLDEEQQAAGEDYLSLMRANLHSLRSALDCA
jgi:zinc transport system substrate-binding protein